MSPTSRGNDYGKARWQGSGRNRGNKWSGARQCPALCRRGSYVFITGRRQKTLDQAVKLIGRNVTGVQGDVANLDALDRLFSTVQARKGQHRRPLRKRRFGRVRKTRSDHRETLRHRLRRQHARHALHGPEGVTALQRWRIHHPDWIDRFDQRLGGLQRVLSQQGCPALLRPHMVERTEGPAHPRQPC